ncbi:IS110 family transposase [Blautia sp.]|uniref:IS110 family transposase n=1 Tax=Blautia sp. TaxID=1955243 RepID=UPI00258B755D|nr:IS110 family transposase [Blautia sp.]
MNCNTQNTKIASITEKTLIVGIDVGSETHYARAFDWRNFEFTRKPLVFSNTQAGFLTFKAWIEEIQEKNGKTAVIPGMEPTGHYWFALGKFLQDNGMKPVHVNPHHVKKSKELDDNNPNKNDRKDPKTIAALVNEGRFSYPYIPTGIYAEMRSLSNLRFQTQEEVTRIKNRIARWFAIYFPEYKDVYRDLKAVSGRMILKAAPLPEDIGKLGVEGVNQIWRDAKLRGTGMKRAKTLVSAAEHSVGSKEAPEAARMELKNLLDDMDVYTSRLEELVQKIEGKLKEIPYIDKLLEIKGIGMVTVSGFIAEVGDIRRFDNPKQLQKLAGYAIVANDSGKHNGESRISYRGRKRLRYVLYEAAISLVGKNAGFREIHGYYRTRKENPLKKMQSVVAVACKVIRVFYTILTKGVDHDAARLLGDIKHPQMQTA